MERKGCRYVVLVLTVLLFGFFTIGQATEYDHEVQSKKITFSWKVAGDTLAVKIAAETKGWGAVGFNPSSKMKGADFVLGYVKNGKAKIRDDFGSSKTSHKPDKKLGGTSDVTLIGGEEVGGVTTIEFTIPLKSGDKKDSEIKVEGDTIVLLAYGPGRDGFTARHKFRTALKVNLATGAFSKLK